MGASSRCRLFMRNFSFEGTNTQRTVALTRSGCRVPDRRCRNGGLILAYGIQERYRRHKKQVSGDGPAEIEQPVVVAGRAANEHIFQHLFDGTGRTAVAN